MTEIIGYLALIRLPKLAVPYADVTDVATNALFNNHYIPKQSSKRNAWQKATNLGGKGLKVKPPATKRLEIFNKYGVDPKVRLHTEVISDSYPVLTRHIVRTVSIPAVQVPGQDHRDLADKQLDQKTVCIMKYDCSTNAMISTGVSELGDESGWVNGDLRQVIDDLHARVHLEVDCADNHEIRAGIRNWLNDNSATLMTSGGAYFIPKSDGVYEALKSMKMYAESLQPFQTKITELPPQIMLIPMTDDGDTGVEIAENAIAQYKVELQSVVDRLLPVIGENGISVKSEKVASNIKEAALVDFRRISGDSEKYKAALGDDLAALEVYVQVAQNHFLKANRVENYKPSKADQENQEGII